MLTAGGVAVYLAFVLVGALARRLTGQTAGTCWRDAVGSAAALVEHARGHLDDLAVGEGGADVGSGDVVRLPRPGTITAPLAR